MPFMHFMVRRKIFAKLRTLNVFRQKERKKTHKDKKRKSLIQRGNDWQWTEEKDEEKCNEKSKWQINPSLAQGIFRSKE